MFSFLQRSGLRSPSGAILRALRADSLSAVMDVAALGVVESRGSYAGRRVTFFRVIDPKRVAGQSADVFKKIAYGDLDAHPELVLRSGHLERDGSVVFNQVRETDGTEGAAPGSAVPLRTRADRSDHADDERVVFPDGER